MENVRRSGRRGASGLGLRLGLVELRRRVGAAAGDFQFGVRADGAWAALRTAAGEESVDDQGSGSEPFAGRGGGVAAGPVERGLSGPVRRGARYVATEAQASRVEASRWSPGCGRRPARCAWMRRVGC